MCANPFATSRLQSTIQIISFCFLFLFSGLAAGFLYVGEGKSHTEWIFLAASFLQIASSTIILLEPLDPLQNLSIWIFLNIVVMALLWIIWVEAFLLALKLEGILSFVLVLVLTFTLLLVFTKYTNLKDTRRKKLLGYSLSAATIADIRPHEVENITGSAENPPTYSSVVNNPKYTTLPSYAEAKSLRSQPNSISKSTNGDQE
ncbi:uncharacterized protein LOC111705080 [Eurytemora carolleeae]|uniref:uncharacterized protein LOC111705080 n=1 Tax=Eurytemora carolleeae TaxID=1294199 RepID=UPI000C76378C|nr:uncharacterized protein LOC111705080 [Eurytemora carolleeae]|eukprot:XP_023333283.1 uncharacterized protein LOC111705080 [Eurytemora affinis]